jgi:hypothetical protein
MAYAFTVAGPGRFPIDMLRYDRCYPKTSEDASEISRTFLKTLVNEYCRVDLISEDDPTEGRWRSFGWHIESKDRIR